MDRAISNARWRTRLLRMPESLFVTPLGAMAVVLLLPVLLLYS